MVGDNVVLQYIDGDLRQPFLSHWWPSPGQGGSIDQPHGGGFPFNHQSRFRMKGGKLHEDELPIGDTTIAEMPRWHWQYNGAFFQISNDGSVHIQSSVNQTPYIPEDVPKSGLHKSPPPRGNLVLSTRGSRGGDIYLTTGKSKVGTADAGNVIIDAATAAQGNIIGQASVENAASQVFLRDAKPDDYLAISSGMSEMSAASKAVMRCVSVLLGSRNADKNAVTWQELVIVMEELCLIFDAHVHSGVYPGSSDTAPPTTTQFPYFEMNKETFMSTVVKLELNHKNTTAAKAAAG